MYTHIAGQFVKALTDRNLFVYSLYITRGATCYARL